MKKSTVIFILVAVALTTMIGGCATPGGGFLNTNVQADAGQAPTSYEQTIRTYLRSSLIDPLSMIDFSVSDPVLTNCAVGIYGPFHGWRVATRYNAKNRLGGYVGLKTYYAWFHGERLKGMGEDATYCPQASGWR